MYQLLPDLSSVEFERLKSLIIQNGAIVPIEVDENGQILDGHHRVKIYGELPEPITNYPIIKRQFNSEAEKKAYVYKINEGRRHLSPDQNKEILEAKKALARELKTPERTQEQIAEMLGVNQTTVSKWLNIHNMNGHNINIDSHLYKDKSLNSNVKVSPKTKQDLLDMASEGKTQEQIAAELKLSQPTVSRILAKDKKNIQKRKNISAKVQGRATIELANAVDWLNRQEQCDLLLTDPPYSTDVKDIQAFAAEWLPLALSHVKPTGRAYIFIGAYPAELLAYLSVSLPTQVLVWEYKNTLGPSPAKNYKQNWQAILYYCPPEAPPLNGDKLTEKFSVQNVNAPDARHEERFHAWEKPIKLADLIIKQATNVGDIIFDPFVGTGTFLLSAALNKRIGFGCDSDQKMIDIAVERGCKLGLEG